MCAHVKFEAGVEVLMLPYIGLWRSGIAKNWDSCTSRKLAKNASDSWEALLIVLDTRAAGPYLFSDGQNIYNRVVLVCVQ